MGSGIRGIRICPWKSGREERFEGSCGSGEDRGYRGRTPRTGGDEEVDIEFDVTGSTQFTPLLLLPFPQIPRIYMSPVVEYPFHLRRDSSH